MVNLSFGFDMVIVTICTVENTLYNPQTDTYTCPQGNPFSYIYTTNCKSDNGFKSTITVYECRDCNNCPQKKLCIRAKGNRKIYVSKDFIALRKESLARITSEIRVRFYGLIAVLNPKEPLVF